jgi:hypothetical protein
MAQRGAKPKPAHLRLVDGTHRTTRHGDAGKAREAVEKVQASVGGLTRPRGMRGKALQAWKEYIEPAAWLDAFRKPAAIAFCELWAEFQESPLRFPASKHGQMRAYMSELGLSDERNRGDLPDEEVDEFFGD